MAFEAKRLRVQLPCRQTTVVPERDARLRPPECNVFSNPNCPTIFDTCAGGGVTFANTCGGGTIAQTCDIATDICANTRLCRFDSFTCPFETCVRASRVCRRASCPDGSREPLGCIGISEPIEEPGTIVIDPEQLPILRRQLEAQLAEVEKAERAIEQRGDQ